MSNKRNRNNERVNESEQVNAEESPAESTVLPLVTLEKGPDIGNENAIEIERFGPVETKQETLPLRRVVDEHRRCPICYHGELNGIARVQSTQGRTRYCKCDRCGHSWSVVYTIEVQRIESRPVSVLTRDGAQITPRAEQ